MNEKGLVEVFSIYTNAFGFNANWFNDFVPRFVEPAYLLVAMFIVISIGILTLKRFHGADFEKKVWNIPATIVLIVLWPFLVLELKELVDTFNTFLVQDIFHMSWHGVHFPSLGEFNNPMGWSAELIARFLPELAFWVVYGFWIVFFFFFAVLGPFILAKGILFDEIQAFLELLKEITILFLWQTTIVILIGFINKDLVSGKPFPDQPAQNFLFMCLVLGIMIFFAPSMTKKFGNHLGSSFFPAGFKWGGMMLGLTAGAKIASAGLAAMGTPIGHGLLHQWHTWKHRVLAAEEFKERWSHVAHGKHLEHEVHHLKHHGHGGHDDHGGHGGHGGGHSHHEHHHDHSHGGGHHEHHHDHEHEHEHHHDHGGGHHEHSHGHSKVVSIFGASTAKNLFADSHIKSASLALHFKKNPGEEAVSKFGKALLQRMNSKGDSVLKMLKKAKADVKPESPKPSHQGASS